MLYINICLTIMNFRRNSAWSVMCLAGKICCARNIATLIHHSACLSLVINDDQQIVAQLDKISGDFRDWAQVTYRSQSSETWNFHARFKVGFTKWTLTWTVFQSTVRDTKQSSHLLDESHFTELYSSLLSLGLFFPMELRTFRRSSWSY